MRDGGPFAALQIHRRGCCRPICPPGHFSGLLGEWRLVADMRGLSPQDLGQDGLFYEVGPALVALEVTRRTVRPRARARSRPSRYVVTFPRSTDTSNGAGAAAEPDRAVRTLRAVSLWALGERVSRG
jgi:hypothetical protein